MHTFYGASECGGIAFDDSDAPRTDGQCVGRPMRGVSVSVSDDGCLAVHSAAVAIGYIGSPTEIDQRVGGGCFRTTDCAIVQGRQLLLTGRLTDCINVAGRKISPHQIESAILRQDADDMAADIHGFRLEAAPG